MIRTRTFLPAASSSSAHNSTLTWIKPTTASPASAKAKDLGVLEEHVWAWQIPVTGQCWIKWPGGGDLDLFSAKAVYMGHPNIDIHTPVCVQNKLTACLSQRLAWHCLTGCRPRTIDYCTLWHQSTQLRCSSVDCWATRAVRKMRKFLDQRQWLRKQYVSSLPGKGKGLQPSCPSVVWFSRFILWKSTLDKLDHQGSFSQLCQLSAWVMLNSFYLTSVP